MTQLHIKTRNNYADHVLNENHKHFILKPKDLERGLFGEAIARYRKEVKLSLGSLAAKCSVTKTQIWLIEAGERYPNSELYTSIVAELKIPGENALRLNELRMISKRIRKDRDLSDILDLSVVTLMMKKNTARTISLLALLKSALARLELNYPNEELLSVRARNYDKEETVVLKPFLEQKHILSFIDAFGSLCYTKENLLTVIAIFAKKVVITRSEYAHLDAANKRDLPKLLFRLIKQINHDDSIVNRFKLFLTGLYDSYDNYYGIKLETLKCFGADFDEVLNDIEKEEVFRILKEV
jgi:transcriptional regulator with XRE-family HTH domain